MRVGVVGLGKMGVALVNRLQSQGFSLVVWNRSAGATLPLVDAGAEAAGSLSDVWRSAEVAMSFLADDDAVRAVLLSADGLVETAPPGAVIVEMSTVSPAVSRDVADAASRRRVNYLRAPVSGNPGVLAAGNITLIVSGSKAALAAAAPVLERVGPKLYYVGEHEEARVLKLAVNSMLAATAQMVAELEALCEASGIDRAVLLDVLSGSAVGSPFVNYKTAALLARTYNATFTTSMLVKDLRLCQDLASQTSVPLPATELVTRLALETCALGMGDLDFLALLPRLQAEAGQATDIPVPWPG